MLSAQPRPLDHLSVGDISPGTFSTLSQPRVVLGCTPDPQEIWRNSCAEAALAGEGEMVGAPPVSWQ